MKLYNELYRSFGVRTADRLVSPPTAPLAKFELPQQSIVHYIGKDDLDVAPDSNEPLFEKITHPIYVSHVLDNGDNLGAPRLRSSLITTEVNNFHTRNRRYKKMVDLESVSKDKSSVVVFNYGFIGQRYVMQRNAYSSYYSWWNRRAAMWKKVAEVAKESDRHQFIILDVPVSLPTLEEFNLTNGDMNTNALKHFTKREDYDILELWKWFGPLRESTLMHRYLDHETLNKVTLIIVDHGRWFMLELGLAEQWRIATKSEIAKDPEHTNRRGLEPKYVQRRFLKSLHVIADLRSVAAKVEEAPAKKEEAKVTPVMNKVTGQIEMKAQVLKPGSAEAGEENPVDFVDPAADGPDYDDLHDEHLDTKIEEELEIISKQAKTVEKIEQARLEPAEDGTLLVPVAPTPEDGVAKVCARLAEQDAISASEMVRYNKLASSYKEITAPDGKSTLEHFIKVTSEDLAIKESPAIPDVKTITDKTMLKSSLHVFDSKYIKEYLPRHIAGMVMNVQNAGIAVTSYEVERVENAIGAYDDITIKVTPVVGASSTWRVKVPALNEDGTWKANGINYNLRKQRTDLPIRKVGPALVALTSYYGKTFVRRSEKRVNNYGEWLCNALMAKGLDEGDIAVQNVNPGDVFDNEFPAPKLYSTLAMRFRSLEISGYVLNLDHTRREELYGKELVEKLEKDGARIIGQFNAKTRTIGSQGKQLLVVGKDSALYNFHPGVSKDLEPLGTIEAMAHLEVSKAPVEFAVTEVQGRPIPVGVVLAFELGLDRLCKLLKVVPRRVQAGTRLNLEANEYALVFKDESLVFNREDRHAAMVLAGFNEYHRQIRQYDAFLFNKRDVYLNILEGEGPSARYLREIDLMYQMFVDPITKELLVMMKEPTDFRGLLLRSCELLLTDQHPDEYDTAYQRFRGNERIAGAVYSELVRAIREHGGRPGRSKLPIDLHPYAVWKTISTDSSMALISEINPVQNLKEREAVTTGGVGGRSSRSMTKRTRGYPVNDMGVISESTVDSSDVGINTYTSADPQFNSLLGTTNRYEIGKTGATALLSTSALLSPGSDVDDPKRVNFIAIQQAHSIACKGYHQMPLRTGYEQVIAHRTGDMFAQTAKKSGKVLSVNEKGVVVEFDDGEKKGIELGRRFGNAAGLTIPHDLVTPLKEGQKFKEGAVLSYNSGFFEPDLLNPSNVIWKAGVLVNVALMESPLTLEDSSAISPRVAELLSTKMTKTKTIVVRFNQKVNKLVKVGTRVEAESILCVIEDEVTASSDLFDEETLDTLSVLSSMTPQAKTNGEVEMIEVFYHGDKEDMSESLRAIADAGDRDMAKRLKASGKKVFTGSVDEGYRVEGNPLALDTMAIKIYITGEVAAGVGDKGVFANQMKTVFGEVLPGDVHTQSGVVVDAIFGRKSIDDRIVGSPDKIGTTTAILMQIGKLAAKMRKK